MDSLEFAASLGLGKMANDLLSPTIKEAGELGRKLFKGLFAGAYHWADRREKMFQELQDDVFENIKNIDPNRITEEAPTYIVAPAMMAWSYSMDNQNLRDMYAKLLAHAAIEDQKDLLHPCFVEIIKQMHPKEAEIFTYISHVNYLPTISILNGNPSGADNRFEYLYENLALSPRKITYGEPLPPNPIPDVYLAVKFEDFDIVNPINLANLERLKLIEVSYEKILSKSEEYNLLFNHPIYKDFKSKENSTYREVTHRKGITEITSFGRQFAAVCIEKPR